VKDITMRKISFCTLFVIVSLSCYSQEDSLPSPTIGWDSLKNLIVYPDLARRAGLEGFVDVEIDVDTNGNVLKTNFDASHELFKSTVQDALVKIKWNPEYYKGKHLKHRVNFPIHFMINSNDKNRMFIKVEPVKSKVMY
jgi:TonB family protein